MSRRAPVYLFLFVLNAATAWGQRAVVVSEQLPGTDAALVATLSDAVGAAGYQVRPARVEELSSLLPDGGDDLLVVPCGRSLPTSTIPVLSKYLHSGGRLLACGVPLWNDLVAKVGDKYLTKADYDAAVRQARPAGRILDLAKAGPEEWRRSTNSAEADSRSLERSPAGPTLHVRTPRLEGWDTLRHALASRMPSGRTLFCLQARGGAATSQLAVELDEDDGSRWIATIPLRTEWQGYAVPEERFKFWGRSKGRGGGGDHLHMDKAAAVCLGVSTSHTSLGRSPQEYWVADLGYAPHPLGEVPQPADVPIFEMLSPDYQVFQAADVTTLCTAADQALVSPFSAKSPTPIISLQPRPRSTGIDKHRPWRWQPLLESRAATGELRGTLGAVLIREPAAKFPGSVYAAFTPADNAFYASPDTKRLITEVAATMRRGLYLKEAGADFYTYFDGQPVKLGARVINLAKVPLKGVVVRFTIRSGDQAAAVYERSFQMEVIAGAPTDVQDSSWQPKEWPADGYTISAELLVHGRVVDKLVHEVHVWKPTTQPHFVESRDGGFYLDGKPWKAHGVNYMPSSGIGLADRDLFEHYLGSAAYDPEVVQRDLRRIRDLGFNAVSVFIYRRSMEAQNLLDLLRRCELLGLRVNLSLRPGTPIQYKWSDWQDPIEYYHLPQNDTVFAYDLAWEACHWDHEYQVKNYRAEWRKWVADRYGTIANAERTWCVPPPKDPSGQLAVPAQGLLLEPGPAANLALDYRAFLDDLLAQRYGDARAKIRAIDPHHLVSFRMNILADPTSREPHLLAYDPWGLRDAVDMWEPEGYGRIGDWEHVKPGIFSAAYARLANPDKPFVWAEVGMSVWDSSAMADSPARLDAQAEFFRRIYRMLRESGSDGVFFWWYPGGYRVNERSDFGIINPDGTDRAATRVIREEGHKFLASPKPVPDVVLKVTRGPTGLYGAYGSVKDAYWRLQESGHHVLLQWESPPGPAIKPSRQAP